MTDETYDPGLPDCRDCNRPPAEQWAGGTMLWDQPSGEGVHVDELAPWLKRVEAPVR